MKPLLRVFGVCRFAVILYTGLIIDLLRVMYYIVSAVSTLIKVNLVTKVYLPPLHTCTPMMVLQGELHLQLADFNLQKVSMASLLLVVLKLLH